MDQRILLPLLSYVSVLVIMQVLKSVKVLSARVAVPVSMLVATLVAGLIGGVGVPLYRAFEGTFGFFYFAVVFVSGMILVRAMAAIGFNESVKEFLVSRVRYRAPIFIVLMLLLMLPGMLTGLGVVGIAGVGSLTILLLTEMGMSKSWAAVFCLVGAILGMVAPPVNLPIMIIGVTIIMPFRGFTEILLLMTFPLAILLALIIGFRYTTREAVEEMRRREKDRTANPSPGLPAQGGRAGTRLWVVSLPLIVVIVLMILERTLPDYTTLSVPLVLMIGALTTVPMIGFKRFFHVAADALKGQTLTIVSILLIAGFQAEILSLVGVRGLEGAFFFGMIPRWLFYAFLFALPWLGGYSSALGLALFLGYPFVLALLPKSAIVTSAAFSLVLCVSEIFPPTALSGNLVHSLVGPEVPYRKILARACLPGAFMIAEAIVFILLADQFSRMFG
jgi:TRAP-type C4-dicarboxylate transport system permease large subunit